MIIISQLRRLTYFSRFEEGVRLEMSTDDTTSEALADASDEEMGLNASTIPLKQKEVIDNEEPQDVPDEVDVSVTGECWLRFVAV